MYKQEVRFKYGTIQINVCVETSEPLNPVALRERVQHSLQCVETSSDIGISHVADTLVRGVREITKAIPEVNNVQMTVGDSHWSISTSSADIKNDVEVTYFPTKNGLVEEAGKKPAAVESEEAADEELWVASPTQPADPVQGDYMVITTGKYKNSVLMLESYTRHTGVCSCTALASFGRMKEGETVEVPLATLRRISEDEALELIEKHGRFVRNDTPLFLRPPKNVAIEDYTDANGNSLEGHRLAQREHSITASKTEDDRARDKHCETHLLLQIGLTGGKMPSGSA